MNDDALTRIIAEAISQHDNETVEELREDLDLVKQQYDQLKYEDRGWVALFGEGEDQDLGLELDTLKEVSKRLRQSVAGSPLPKQANALRYSYTFSQPFIIPEVTDKKPGGAGRPSNRMKFYSNPVNQRYAFGKGAQELISTACSTDGCYLAVASRSEMSIRPVPLSEIVGLYVNPGQTDEVWAYQRQWRPAVGKDPVSRWYYTDKFTGRRQRTMKTAVIDDTSNPRVQVDEDKTMIDLVVNQQTGWPLGIPDLMAGEVWNRKFITMTNHGEEVSATLAYYAAKVRTKSKKGSDNVGVRVNQTGGGGRTITHGEGNEVDVFSSAGRVYDFEKLRPIAAMYASSVGISVVDLLASPAAAGSSYGSASALAPGMRRGIETRRTKLASWMERIFAWATKEELEIVPASIEEIEPYRRAQILYLAQNSGLFWEDEIRPVAAYLAGITLHHDGPPKGYMKPNNKDSLPRADVDADATGGGSSTASPDQGKSNGSGGGGSTAANDQRTDKVSK